MWIQYSQSSLGTTSLIEINPSKEGNKKKENKENRMQVSELQSMEIIP